MLRSFCSIDAAQPDDRCPLFRQLPVIPNPFDDEFDWGAKVRITAWTVFSWHTEQIKLTP